MTKTMPRWARSAMIALPLAAAACSQSGEEGADTASAEPAAAAAPEAIPVTAGEWRVSTTVWKVEGDGPGAEEARAMQGQGAVTLACLDEAAAQRSYVALVEAATGSECQQTGTSAEAPQTGSDTPRLRGALLCTGGDGAQAPASFVVDDLQPGSMAGSLERSATPPGGGDAITMHINVQATREGDCA